MRMHKMEIFMIADNGCQPITLYFFSPHRIVQGMRLRIGWFLIRIASRILYGREWVQGVKKDGTE